VSEIKIRNKRIDDELLMKKRRDWLNVWPTGREVDFEEAVSFQKSLPDSRIWWKVMARLRKEGRMSVFPRAGTGLLENMIALCRSLADSGVVLIPVTTDSYTRQGDFKKVEQALEEERKTGNRILNGFPVINYGVYKTRKLIESCEAAFSPRGAGGEIAIAAGMTSAAGESFLGFGSYTKKPTLEESLIGGQYRYRLVGWYAERGVMLSGDIHGWQPNCVFPLSVNIATHIIEALSAAEQGHRALTPLLFLMGNMTQDLAYIRLAPRLIREYLDKFGFRETLITGIDVEQIPLFPVPQDMGGAFAYLNYAAMVAALSGREAVGIRTVDEAAGVPSKEAHQMSYRSAKWIFDVVREQKIEFEIEDIYLEEKIAEQEIRAIMDRLFDLGEGDILVGAVKGVEAGVLDSPWSSNIHAKDKVLGVRDTRGACRYLEFGNLPFSKEIKDFHREKIAQREKIEGKKIDYYTAVHDLWCFSKGKIVGLPPFNQ
jgi:methylaspartate mutase epsilon subunit